MKMCMNFKFVVLFALTLLAGSTVYGQDNVIDEVVWVVGDEAILKSEVEEARMSALYEGRKFDRDPYCVIPEEIAVQKLFLHQAALDSIEVSESEVIQRVDYMTNMYISNIGSREKMEEYFNKTSSQIRETLRENAREGLKVQKMQQKLVGEIKVTPAEVRRYFKDLPQDSIPYIPTQVEVQIITQQPKVPLEEIENVKKRLRDFTDRITKGETSFSTLARMYSEDRGSAIRGGEIEFSGRGMLDPAYANVAFNLQDPNKVSKIVESEYGFHIIQLIEKRGDRIKTRHILLKPHIPEESLTAGMARLDSIADDIRNGKFSFEEAASVLSQDKDTRNNHGLLPNPNTNTSKFEMQELPPELVAGCDLLVLDEPTAVLTPQETRELFVAIRNLIAENKAVIFISHKLNEVMEISKVITILHLGKVVGSVLASETNAKQLASMMVGKEVSFETPKGEQKLGDVMLEVVDMHAKNSTGVETVRGLNMKVRAGEIYGIAGVDGNGQSELIRGIVGLCKKTGTVRIAGEDVSNSSPRQILDRGVSHIPEDRQGMGVVMNMSIRNILCWILSITTNLPTAFS